jgi:hypothetical protein
VDGRTVKALLISNIIHQQNPHRAPIIRRGDRPEPLLTRRIPDLQFHPFAIEVDGADLEVDADGRDEGRGERIFAETE